MKFIEYPKCSTCKKAKDFLVSNGIDFVARDIVIDNPSFSELKEWVVKYNIEIKKLFNTSGLQYKALGLKDKLPNLTDDEKLEILSSNGMLVKRPLLITDDFMLIGFKESAYKESLGI